jgi:hypothetical protein
MKELNESFPGDVRIGQSGRMFTVTEASRKGIR